MMLTASVTSKKHITWAVEVVYSSLSKSPRMVSRYIFQTCVVIESRLS